MPDVLIYADSVRSPELRHEVPVEIGDPFIYAERNGSRHVFVTSFEIPRLQGVADLTVAPLEDLGVDELVGRGLEIRELDRELVLRACRLLDVADAVVPAGFPLETADHLRANGISLTPDGGLFDTRRRAKTEAELAGIRRAQRSCERALDAIREGLRPGGEVTCEQLRAAAIDVFNREGMLVPAAPIVSHGAQTAIGHDPGSGPIAPGESIVVDLYPQDPESGCFADMTRTFCVGEPPPELTEYHRLCREALERVVPKILPGALGRELYDVVCDLFEEHGFPTQRTKAEDAVLTDGFNHSLGHGVGLDIHEAPGLGRSGVKPLVVGDVLAIEPGLYRRGFGGCRLEDLVLVTENGSEVLTDYPYDLEP